MKRIYLTLLLMTPMMLMLAQPIARTMVVIEKATGTWCVWCPSAAVGCEQLLEAGAPIAVVSNHNGDNYANQYSNARNSMYAISGYPTSVFDGKEKVVGGSSSGTTVGMYAPVVQNHMAEMCPVSLDMEVEVTDAVFDITITVTKLDAISASDLRLIFFVTESHIPQTWFTQTEVNHVNRLMLPDVNGTSLDFSSGDVQTVELSFTWDPSWEAENCEFIACVQNADAGQTGGNWVKSILNGMKRGVIDLTADFEADVTSVEVGQPVSFTSEYSGGYIGPVPVTFHWDFPGATPDTSNVANPVVSYNTSGYHDVTFTVNKGGQILEVLKPGYIYVAPGVGIPGSQNLTTLSCYPNPSSGEFRMELFTSGSSVADLQIVNTVGNIVYQESQIPIPGKLVRNLDLDLPGGVYFLMIRNGEQELTRKLVIL